MTARKPAAKPAAKKKAAAKKPAAKKPAAKKKATARQAPATRADLSREQFLAEKLIEIEALGAEAARARNYNAATGLASAALKTRKELDEERARLRKLEESKRGKVSDLPEGELLERLERDMRSWSNRHLEVALRVYEEKNRVRIVFEDAPALEAPADEAQPEGD